MESTLTAKGQVTIPKPIRDHLNLSPGDRIKFFLHLDGTVVILPKLPSSALKGILSPRKGRPPAVPEKQAAAAKGAFDRTMKRLKHLDAGKYFSREELNEQ